ncbi:MAG: VapE family protein [Advenella sp.]|uniref:VapE domain-containing protein n=1 Tax=Advenella sp. TaxID=1872388 RepID=UPI00258AC432|nr:VapE domain-containing protein [Advenella sp.]MDD3757688.1 VapE family protein [Advenella sp.]
MQTKIDFKEVASYALSMAETLVPQWLPAGRKNGAEWQCGNLQGEPGKSLSVNLNTGIWADFASGERGGDLISLYAAIFTGNDQLKALKELAEQLHIRAIQPEAATIPVKKQSKSPWVPVMPIPENAGPRPVAHIKRGRPEQVWCYKNQQGQSLGYVYRFITSTGGKEIIPLVYAKNTNASGDSFDYRWVHFPEPRPIYGLDRLTNKTVLIVEGEKCADAADIELRNEYDVVSWPGGANAVHKVDWSVLSGRKVLIWPDCDSQMNKDKTDLLKEKDQPGMKAALKISEMLSGLDCKIRLVKIDKPGIKADGWDVADAIEEGLKGKELIEWLKNNQYKYEPEIATESVTASAQATAGKKEKKAPSPAGAESWHSKFLLDDRFRVDDRRENVAICLENHPALKGCIAYNEFTARVMLVKPMPWRASLGEWTDNDDLELSNFLAFNAPGSFKSLSNIGLAVQMVANRNKYHPLQDWITGLQWDGQDRLSTWMTDLLGVADTPYSRLIGRLWMRQAANRAINPGCKADYVLILEGPQGLNKSSALRVLGGDYFSDAPLDMNSKDVYQTINGVHIFEIAELDAFNRSEATRIKAFITQPVDRYRLPYEKRMIDQPRHVVFAGTTNNYEYHKDTTGNRRFWSVRCTNILLDHLREIREQLFAQALFEVQNGERCYPTRQEEAELIAPEQEMREIVDAWHQIISDYFNEPENRSVTKITTRQVLMDVIKMEASKITSTRQSETKVGNIMHKLGWVKKRETSGPRGYYYARQVNAPTRVSSVKAEDHEPLPI